MEDMIPTPDQQKALDYIEDWLLNSDEPVCLLYGSAGTGKTALLRLVFALVEERMKNRYPFIKVTAPTHIAKNVVRDATGKSATTLTKFLNLIPDSSATEFDINNPVFIEKQNANPSAVSLLGSDEASMIKEWEYEALYKKAKSLNRKILFVGDICQISPVKEEDSVVFRRCKKRIGLKQLVRQEITNPITIPILAIRYDVLYYLYKKLSREWRDEKHLLGAIDKENLRTFMEDIQEEGALLRKQVTTEMNKFGKVIKQEPDLFKQVLNQMPQAFEATNALKGYDLLRKDDNFIRSMLDDFQEVDTSNNEVTCLAFSNHKVNYYNKVIRDELFPHSKPFVEGDLVMGYKNIKNGHLKVLVNSETYVIDRAESAARRGIHGTEVLLRSKGSNMFRTTLFIVDNHEENIIRFLKLHEKYRTVGNMHDYLQFKDNFLLSVSLDLVFKDRQLPDGIRYIKKKDLPKKDIDYAYCRTFHKSQGMTTRHAYVDAKSATFILGRPGHAKLEFYRLLYVALSRATDFVTILL